MRIPRPDRSLQAASRPGPRFAPAEQALRSGLNLDLEIPEVPPLDFSDRVRERYEEIVESLGLLRSHAEQIRQFLFADRVDIGTPLRKLSAQAQAAIEAISRDAAARADLRDELFTDLNQTLTALVQAEASTRAGQDAVLEGLITTERNSRTSAIAQATDSFENAINALQLQVAALASAASAPAKTRLLVKSVEDLLPPDIDPEDVVGDEILLPSGAVEIDGAVDLGGLAVRLQEGTHVYGVNPANDGFISANTNGVIRAADIGEVIMANFFVVATQGPAISLADSTQTWRCNLFSLLFLGCQSAGTISGFRMQCVKACYCGALIAPSGTIIARPGGGITFSGETHKTFVAWTPFEDMDGGSCIRFASAYKSDFIHCVGNFFKVSGNGAVVGIEAEAGATFDNEAIFHSNLAEPDALLTTVVGLSSSDPGTQWRTNTGIRDSRVVAKMYFDQGESPLETTFSGPDTPTKLLVPTALDPLSERVDMPDDQRFRLVQSGSGRETLCNITAVVTLDPAANNQAFNLYWAKNGTIQPDSLTRVRVAAGADERTATVMVLEGAEADDHFEVWIENLTSGASVECLGYVAIFHGTD